MGRCRTDKQGENFEMKYKCVFCGKEHEGYGNSCWPIYNDEKVRCCDGCNRYIVVPERIKIDELAAEMRREVEK